MCGLSGYHILSSRLGIFPKHRSTEVDANSLFFFFLPKICLDQTPRYVYANAALKLWNSVMFSTFRISIVSEDEVLLVVQVEIHWHSKEHAKESETKCYANIPLIILEFKFIFPGKRWIFDDSITAWPRQRWEIVIMTSGAFKSLWMEDESVPSFT